MVSLYRLGIKLTALLIPYFICCPIIINKYPMKFMDEEYAYYQQNKDYSEMSSGYSRILILGDSTAKAAWLPAQLSDDTYNLALGGVSPIEEFYYLREYLQVHDAPQAVVFTQGADHFWGLDTFWTRSMYFHRFKLEDLYDLLQEIRGFNDKSIFGEVCMNGECFLYLTYSPIKYSNAFVKGLLSSKRYIQNRDKYTAVSKSKGQTQFGTAEYYDGVSAKYMGRDSFEASPIIDHYFRKMIELCEEYHIQFVFQNPPINESTYTKLNKQFISEYKVYLNGIGKDYPDALVDPELFSYESIFFGDSTHLNRKGTIRFSNEMKKKYQNIFRNENDSLIMEES